MHENESNDTTCPHCQIGRITQSQRPYLEMVNGHLFTIPKAICFTCDVCDFTEFDRASVELVNSLVFNLTSSTHDDSGIDSLRHLSTADDEIKTKPIQVLPSS